MVSEQHRSYAAAVVMEASSHGNQAENARTSSNQRSDEFDDPFYLHATENPNLSLVSPPLTELNYSSWSRSMKIALEVKNKFGFVDGKIPSPDENDPKYASWRRCNRIVSSWMLRSLNPSIADGMMYFDKASDIWNALQKRYSQSDPHRISFLLCECTPTCSCTLPVNKIASLNGIKSVFLHKHSEFVCDACHLAKHKRSAFPVSTSRTDRCFDLLHMDVWGPFAVASLKGEHYFLTIVDDHSRFTLVTLSSPGKQRNRLLSQDPHLKLSIEP